MTLTDARKILERCTPENQLVKEALDLAISLLPTESNTPSATERLSEIRRKIALNKDGYDPFETRSRSVYHVAWRNCVFYQMRNEGYSYAQIGKASGYDHSTVLLSYNRFKGYLETRDRATTDIWNEFRNCINQ